jgi:prepilin-type N-terminal cleavage/methylation domain-containing protein
VKTPDRKGFTFLEVMLVVFIALLMASVSVPVFMGSFRGAKLKSSAGTIAAVHKYARSVSVLQQKQAAVLFDSSLGTVKVISMSTQSGGFSGRLTDLPSMNENDPDATYDFKTELTRTLDDDIRIVDVDIEAGSQEEDGIYFVNYFVNGMCDKYEVVLADKNDRRMYIDVDYISGSVTIEE